MSIDFFGCVRPAPSSPLTHTHRVLHAAHGGAPLTRSALLLMASVYFLHDLRFSSDDDKSYRLFIKF